MPVPCKKKTKKIHNHVGYKDPYIRPVFFSSYQRELVYV